MKTKETSVCRKCGGNGKPSKGFMNFHNIQFPYDENKAEFETKLLNCIKCESCGHSWIPEKTQTTRQQAIAWWNQLNHEKQIDLQYIYRSPSRHPLNSIGLTGKEIEEIWLKEMQNISEERTAEQHSYKPNQKQFVKFDESLFKAYISKFSEKDKYEMLRILAESF